MSRRGVAEPLVLAEVLAWLAVVVLLLCGSLGVAHLVVRGMKSVLGL